MEEGDENKVKEGESLIIKGIKRKEVITSTKTIKRKENKMKQVILITIFCFFVTNPVHAQEVVSSKSIEGTVWVYTVFPGMGRPYVEYIGFYDDLLYTSYIRSYECFHTVESSSRGYIDLPCIALFWHKKRVGILFPLIGVGIQSCIPIPCPFQDHTLKLVPDISLPDDFCPLGIIDHVMTKAPKEGSGCEIPTQANTFYHYDEAAYCWMVFTASSLEDEIRCMWYKPNGELYHEELTLSSYMTGCWYPSILISGHTPANTPGEWRVDVYYNGIKAFTEYFTIIGSNE